MRHPCWVFVLLLFFRIELILCGSQVSLRNSDTTKLAIFGSSINTEKKLLRLKDICEKLELDLSLLFENLIFGLVFIIVGLAFKISAQFVVS